MRYEIHRKESCRPEDMNMYEWLLKGRSRVGIVTTEHPASSYGQPVVIVEQWGGLIDYKDIKSINLISDGENDSELVETREYLQSKLAPFGINVSW